MFNGTTDLLSDLSTRGHFPRKARFSIIRFWPAFYYTVFCVRGYVDPNLLQRFTTHSLLVDL